MVTGCFFVVIRMARMMYHLVGINHLVERDDTLRELRDLPNNFEAERESVESPWVRSRID